MNTNIIELNTEEVEIVNGGIIVFAPAFAPAFKKGAIWGAGVVLAAYGISQKGGDES